jgi:hypothetical protein
LVQRSISPLEFFFSELGAKDFDKAKNRLLGWFIETYSKKRNRNEIRKAIGISGSLLISYRNFLIENPDDPYRHLIPILSPRKKPKEEVE